MAHKGPRKRRRKKRPHKYKQVQKEQAIVAKYGKLKRPQPVTVRSMDSGEVIGVYRQWRLIGTQRDRKRKEKGEEWFLRKWGHLGYQSYGGYLRSKHWRHVKKRWVDSGLPRRCAVCGSSQYQLHHLTYERLGHERLSDLVPVCNRHHKAAHKLIGRRIAGERVTLENAVAVLLAIEADRDAEIERRFDEAT